MDGRHYGFKSFQIDLYKRRLEVLSTMQTELSWLLEDPFPVIYGFKLKEKSLVWRPCKDGPHTIVADNLSPKELRLVLVPAKFLDRVKGLLSSSASKDSIEVKPIHEVLKQGVPVHSDERVYEYLQNTRLLTEEEFDQFINSRTGNCRTNP